MFLPNKKEEEVRREKCIGPGIGGSYLGSRRSTIRSRTAQHTLRPSRREGGNDREKARKVSSKLAKGGTGPGGIESFKP